MVKKKGQKSVQLSRHSKGKIEDGRDNGDDHVQRLVAISLRQQFAMSVVSRAIGGTLVYKYYLVCANHKLRAYTGNPFISMWDKDCGIGRGSAAFNQGRAWQYL